MWWDSMLEVIEEWEEHLPHIFMLPWNNSDAVFLLKKFYDPPGRLQKIINSLEWS